MSLPSGSILHDKADVTTMSPITQKLDAILKAEGFTALCAGRSAAPTVYANHLEYIRGKYERIFITTHERKDP